MIYEIRDWADGQGCLYTDDRRVRDMAVQSSELRIIGRYFRSAQDRQPFAWDIVGRPDIVGSLAARFGQKRQRKAATA